MTSLVKLSLSTFRDAFTRGASALFSFYLKAVTLRAKCELVNMAVNHWCVGVWSQKQTNKTRPMKPSERQTCKNLEIYAHVRKDPTKSLSGTDIISYGRLSDWF